MIPLFQEQNFRYSYFIIPLQPPTICTTVTWLPSVLIFTGSGLVEIIPSRLPPNLADAHLHLTAV